MASALAASIISALKSQANPTKAKGQQAYFKNVVQFYGLASGDVQEVAKRHFSAARDLVATEGRQALYEVVKTLAPSEYHEQKQMMTWLMNMTLEKKPFKLGMEDLTFLGKEVFDARHAYDWATVDTLCGRVLHYVLINEGNNSDSPASIELQNWAKTSSDNLWKQRASCVAFVKLAKHGHHDDAIMEIASHCIQNKERFVQLGVGWMLREMFLSDGSRVVNFITSNYPSFSREGLRYAIEKMDEPLKNQLLRYDPHSPSVVKVTASTSKSKSASSPSNASSSTKSSKKTSSTSTKTAPKKRSKQPEESEDDEDVDFKPTKKKSKF